MTSLLNISIALLAGLLMTRVFNLWNLPDVTAFLTAGLLIGPCALGRLGIPGLGFPTYDNVEALSLLSDVAMGFIAFSIGTEFRLESLQKTGKQAFVIGVFQGVTAAVLVDIAMICLHMWKPDLLSMPAAITLGAIATATAPAATLMVVRQYKAKGELTELLLPIVALDDAVGLIVFAVSVGIAKAMLLGKIDIISIAVGPLIKILASLMLGTLAGIALTRLETMFHSNTNRNSMTIAFVILTVGLSSLGFAAGPLTIGFSPLLVCMMLGTVFCNISPLAEDLMARADKWSQPLLAVFFVVSGAELELAVFQDPMLVLIGVVFILSRCLGKYSGAFASAKAMACSPNVVKYLGVTLFPQAGVALGMCIQAKQLGEDGSLVRNIILFAVLIYEMAGPLMTKKALTAAGDIVAQPQEVRERRARKLAVAPPKAFLQWVRSRRKNGQ